MKRSMGVRAKKADKEQLAVLRAKLATVPSHEWMRAQTIFDQMTALVGAKGPTGSRMVPRSCRNCKYYGHSRHQCPHADPAIEKELREIKRFKMKIIKGPEDCDPEIPHHWKWVQWQRGLKAIYDELADGPILAKGLWKLFFEQRAAELADSLSVPSSWR